MVRAVDRRRRKGGGTAVGAERGVVNVQKLAEALATPGIDSRIWFGVGTVGVKDPQGTFITDPESVFASQLGAVVDVRLEPSGRMITAKWSGISVGRFGSLLFPIRAGDDVLVSFPSGDPNDGSATIIALDGDRTALTPADWNNDRVLFDLNVDMEIRGPGIKITSPNLVLNTRPVRFGPGSI